MAFQFLWVLEIKFHPQLGWAWKKQHFNLRLYKQEWKVNRQCLLDTTRTVRVSEKTYFDKWWFKQADPSFEKKDFSTLCENKI